MPNHYFQFKQFKVEQEKCAMKVCTDSCLFGAWISIDETVSSVLDIGAGTGLLSLMLAQKTNAKIDAIEIDENAFEQATENFDNAVWKDRLKALKGDVKTFPFTQKYDFIVCNPPFFEREFASLAEEEKVAKHSLHLTLPYLLTAIKNLLNSDGKFAILLPYYRKDEFEKLAAQFNFYPKKTISIRQSTAHEHFRYAGIYSTAKIEIIQKESIAIKTTHLKYTQEATALLQPYYLYL